MPIELHNAAGHRCLMFTDTADGTEGVQSNQFLIVDEGTGAILDPGGNLAYSELYLGMTQHFAPQRLSAILASHADPDIVASLDRWMTSTQAPLYISRVWERFIPHFCKPGKTVGRVVPIPDAGMRVRVGRYDLVALPAHFLHAEGNFQFWDPASRILFSGDLAASIGADPHVSVSDLASHVKYMEAFHRRYMVSRKVLQWWARMARSLPIAMIAPQHGAPLVGEAVDDFIDWAEQLECGIVLFGPQTYAVP